MTTAVALISDLTGSDIGRTAATVVVAEAGLARTITELSMLLEIPDPNFGAGCAMFVLVLFTMLIPGFAFSPAVGTVVSASPATETATVGVARTVGGTEAVGQLSKIVDGGMVVMVAGLKKLGACKSQKKPNL